MRIYMCIIYVHIYIYIYIYLVYKREIYILRVCNNVYSYIHKYKNIYISHLIIFCWLIWFEVKFRPLGPFAILPETPVSFNGSVVEKHCF